MPEEFRYFTLSGDVPNGGVPPGRMFASVAGLPFGPNPGSHAFSGGFGPPPVYHAPQYNGSGHVYYPTLHPGPPPPAPPTPTPATASNRPFHEPPGQYLDGHMLGGNGWSYITPSEHTIIHFISDGVRPFEYPNGYYPHQFKFTKHKVPTMMTVKELIKGLGAPEGDHNGITEMEELGDGTWSAKVTITQGSEDAKKTLAAIGWSQWESEAAPIWLAVKR